MFPSMQLEWMWAMHFFGADSLHYYERVVTKL